MRPCAHARTCPVRGPQPSTRSRQPSGPTSSQAAISRSMPLRSDSSAAKTSSGAAGADRSSPKQSPQRARRSSTTVLRQGASGQLCP